MICAWALSQKIGLLKCVFAHSHKHVSVSVGMCVACMWKMEREKENKNEECKRMHTCKHTDTDIERDKKIENKDEMCIQACRYIHTHAHMHTQMHTNKLFRKDSSEKKNTGLWEKAWKEELHAQRGYMLVHKDKYRTKEIENMQGKCTNARAHI